MHRKALLRCLYEEEGVDMHKRAKNKRSRFKTLTDRPL